MRFRLMKRTFVLSFADLFDEFDQRFGLGRQLILTRQFQLSEVGVFGDRHFNAISQHVLELATKRRHELIPFTQPIRQVLNAPLFPEFALVMHIFEAAQFLGLIEQSNDGEVTGQEVLEPATFRVTGVLSFAE